MQPNSIKQEKLIDNREERVKVSMNLREKINEVLEPILGERLQYRPIFFGIVGALLPSLFTLLTGGGFLFNPMVALNSGIGTAILNAIFELRIFNGKRKLQK